jgi:XTP/dITP diphosphohydrolase
MKIYLASGNAHKVQEFQAIADAARAAGGVALEFVSAKAVGGMPAVVEDAGTFTGNARKKAVALRAKILESYPAIGDAGLWVLSDDSGLCVDALGGAPGVESAYYAGPEGDGAANLRKLVEVMRAVPASGTEHRTTNVEHRTSNDGGEGARGGEEGNPQRSTFNTERLNSGGPLAARSRLPGAPRGAYFVCVLVLLGPKGVERVFDGRCEGALLVEPRGGAGFGYDPLFVPAGETQSLAEMGEAAKNQISHRARAAAKLMAWWGRREG